MDTPTAAVVVIGIFALVAIIAFIRFRKHIRTEIKGPFGMSLEVEGNDEPVSTRGGITARGVKSGEGGLLAEERTGSGIEVENVDVKRDVFLSSSKGFVPSSQQAQPGQFPMGLSAQALSAGGNITVQQFVGNQLTLAEQLAFFVQQVGLVNPRRDYDRAQFEAYSNVWKSLQSLRLAADDLWERASVDGLVRFAELLRQTTTMVREGEIFFEDADRNRLIDILRVCAEFRVGKERLIEIRSRRQLYNVGADDDLLHRRFRDQIVNNSQIKAKYEAILEDIRGSFRRRLSTP